MGVLKMGKSYLAYSCPCGWSGIFNEVKKHQASCNIYKKAKKRDDDFMIRNNITKLKRF